MRSGAVPRMPNALAGRLDAGTSHTCIVDDAGRVRCWGGGGGGPLGYGNIAGHTCAITDDSAVRCWGQGFGGRLGYANTASIGGDERPVVAGSVQLGRRVRAISAGGSHTCAILDDGTVRCWGVGSTFFGSGHLVFGNTVQIGDEDARSAPTAERLRDHLGGARRPCRRRRRVGRARSRLAHVDGTGSRLGTDQSLPDHVGAAGSDQAHVISDHDAARSLAVRARAGPLPVHDRRHQPGAQGQSQPPTRR